MAFSSATTDFNIPLNVITKIIAETVTDNISVQEDYVKALSRATSIFVLVTTERANSIAAANTRKTIHAQDVIEAVGSLGFPQLVPDLINWHASFMGEKENAQKTKKKKEEGDSKQEGSPAPSLE